MEREGRRVWSRGQYGQHGGKPGLEEYTRVIGLARKQDLAYSEQDRRPGAFPGGAPQERALGPRAVRQCATGPAIVSARVGAWCRRPPAPRVSGRKGEGGQRLESPGGRGKGSSASSLRAEGGRGAAPRVSGRARGLAPSLRAGLRWCGTYGGGGAGDAGEGVLHREGLLRAQPQPPQALPAPPSRGPRLRRGTRRAEGASCLHCREARAWRSSLPGAWAARTR